MGPGRWDAEALAQELGCSVRTVRRILQTLNESGIPCRYDSELKAYRVPRGFKFPGLDSKPSVESTNIDAADILPLAARLASDGEQFLQTLRAFCVALGRTS
jgi:predicted DNA-binding transcriptional regulator YafY